MARAQPFGAQLPPPVQPVEEEQEDQYYFVDVGDGVTLEVDSDGELRCPRALPSPPAVEVPPPAALVSLVVPAPAAVGGDPDDSGDDKEDGGETEDDNEEENDFYYEGLARENRSAPCTRPRWHLATSPGCFGTPCWSWETQCIPCTSPTSGPSHRLAPIT
jgi:hypothetical protein